MSGGSLPSKLEVQLTAGNSRPLMNTPVYIEVSSVDGGTRRGYTDSDGRVNFDVPSGSSYQLLASGPGIESASASIVIPASQRFYHEELEVKLQTPEGTRAPGGMVSASKLRVPEKAQHEFAQGMKEMSAHNWSKARQHFEKAIKVYPQFGWSYNNIGVTYVQEKNTKAAREAFEKAVAINDKNADAVRNLARMKLMENDCSGGKALLLRLGPDPRDLDALTMLAFAQLQTHEFDAALTNALKVHRGEPDRFPLAHLVAARVYEIKGNQSAAQAQYQMYLKEAPSTPEAQVAREGMQRLAAK
jgi:tetratricopeptide (TPR) repeat protein